MHTKGPWELQKTTGGYRIITGGKYTMNLDGPWYPSAEQLEAFEANARLIAAAPEQEDDINALANIVAFNSHGDGCYAEYWWDSSCDCGLMDLVMQLSPRLQNKLEAIRKAKDE